MMDCTCSGHLGLNLGKVGGRRDYAIKLNGESAKFNVWWLEETEANWSILETV